jgi:hypothetical protein
MGGTGIVLAAAALAASLAGSGALAAPAPKPAAPYVAPRASDGHPDLNGVWQALNTANFDIEAHPARAALALRPGPLGPVPAKPVLALGAVGAVPPGLSIVEGGEIPYTQKALAQKRDNAAHWLERDPEIKCFLPGVPRANYMPYPFQIFQSAKALLFAYEYAGAARNILFTDPGPAPVDSWMGQSVGHWEGDTLVVEVTGQNDSTWLDRAGDFHSDQLKVVERYTPTGPETLSYEAEITDPEVYTRPWKMRMMLYRRVGEDAQLLQFNCVPFVEELMYGALRKEPLK